MKLRDQPISLKEFLGEERSTKRNKSSIPKHKKNHLYPVLIVENLPKTFGKIDKNNSKKRPEFSKEEEYLLNLIARVAVEIFIKEELWML